VPVKRLYILLILFSAFLLPVQKGQACNRLQPVHKTSPNFLKKLYSASCPIQDMLVNLDDEKDDDETSSKRSRNKVNKVSLLHNIRFNLCLQEMPLLQLYGVGITDPPNPQFHENILFSKVPISIAICCFRL
jgi:hypothetical protein